MAEVQLLDRAPETTAPDFSQAPECLVPDEMALPAGCAATKLATEGFK